MCSYFLRALHAFIFTSLHFIYAYANKKLTQINEWTYLWLLTFVITEFSHLSTFIKYFNFLKTLDFF